jgi:hypothetical protein
MSPKQKNQQAQKLMCLSFLLLENLDNLKVTEPKILKYKEDLIGFIEEMSASIADTDAIQKSTYFFDLQNKIDTVIRHSFKDL